ncbi:MAG: hypothetical protein LBM71_05700 [Elusimicrobiota bacterium]|jgi:hypothetical protein|nr:hypothetical protein [Elusimicrobiota bacterium]
MIDSILKLIAPQKIKDTFFKVKNFLKGKKTYLAASILLLQSLLSYLDQTLAMTSFDQLIPWIKALGENPATLHLAEALGLFGIRAALGSKKTDSAQTDGGISTENE